MLLREMMGDIIPIFIINEWINDKNYLYHGSSAESALKILQSQKLMDFTQSRLDPTKKGVSFTRNVRYASTGSDDAGRRSSKVGGETIGTDVIFVFDSAILKTNKVVAPVSQSMGKKYDDTMTKGTAQTEYEEFVHGAIPLDKQHGFIGYYINNNNINHTLKYQLSQFPGFMFRSMQSQAVYAAKDKLKQKQQAAQNTAGM